MEFTNTLSGLKWKILKELAKKEKNPLELSKKIKKSLPNISQQLQLLEALNLIKKRQVPNTKKGKPRTLYSLKKKIEFITLLDKDIARQQTFEFTPVTSGFLKMLFHTNEKQAMIFIKTYFKYPELFNNTSIALIDYSEKEIFFLIITNKKYELMKKMDKATITYTNKKQNIKTLIYTPEDFHKELKEKSELFMNLIKAPIIYDPENNFQKVNNE